VSGQLHALAGTHWTGGWVGPTTGLDPSGRDSLNRPDRLMYTGYVLRYFALWGTLARGQYLDYIATDGRMSDE
jgi:hypothetical protein